MTLPNMPFDSTDPADLPQGVVAPSQLGSSLQDQSASKFRAEAASRFPSTVNSTSAGNPATPGGPLGFLVGLFSNFVENVANADPATINTPDDLQALINPFFHGLPLEEMPVIGDLIEILTGKEDGNLNDLGTWVNNLKSWLTGGSVSGDDGGWFDGLGVVGAAMFGALLQGLTGSSTAVDLPTIQSVASGINNRITALEDGGAFYVFTTTGTYDLSAHSRFEVYLYEAGDGGRHGTVGGTSAPQAGNGGRIVIREMTAAQLEQAGVDLSAVSIQIGVGGSAPGGAGGPTKFGDLGGGDWAINTDDYGTGTTKVDVSGIAWSIDDDLYRCGDGGRGGYRGSGSGSTFAFSLPGVSTRNAEGGARGIDSSTAAGGNASDGEDADYDSMLSFAGGGGGGGGGYGGLSGNFNEFGLNGGNAGFGGWPGGGGGGGGGAGDGAFSDGTPGTGRPGAYGACLIIAS